MEILVYRAGKGFYEKEVDDNYRDEFNIRNSHNILVKAGSDVLLTRDGKIDREAIHHLFEQMAFLVRDKIRVTYVTSGAKAAGRDYVGERARSMGLRSLCTAGQPRLMQVYHEISSIWPDIIIGQALVEDIHFQEARRESTKKGFDEFARESNGKGIMIVNANDFAWTGETKYDNDALAANLFKLLRCDLGIFLTNVDGLYRDFRTDNERLVNLVYGINSQLYKLIEKSASLNGTGGLETKLRKGAKKILDFGGKLVIANGKKPNVILDILNGDNIGTLFVKSK